MQKKQDIDFEELRPELTKAQWLMLREAYKRRFADSPPTVSNEQLWFGAVLDVLWHAGYCVAKRSKS